MTKHIVFALLLAFNSAAFAMTYFLESQWLERGNRFCKYSNGTVLNVGVSTCPLKING